MLLNDQSQFLISASLTTTGPSVVATGIRDAARRCKHVKSRATGLPRCQIVKVIPSGLRPSFVSSPMGSNVDYVPVALTASFVTVLHTQ